MSYVDEKFEQWVANHGPDYRSSITPQRAYAAGFAEGSIPGQNAKALETRCKTLARRMRAVIAQCLQNKNLSLSDQLDLADLDRDCRDWVERA